MTSGKGFKVRRRAAKVWRRGDLLVDGEEWLGKSGSGQPIRIAEISCHESNSIGNTLGEGANCGSLAGEELTGSP